MSNRMTLAIAAVAAVLILILAGVIILIASGGGDDDNSSPSASATRQSGDDNGDSVDGGPSSGELRVLGAEPLFLDPAIIQDADSAEYAVEIFSGLVRLDKDLTIQPDLAERWDVSDDGLTYTFHLNPRATFHDGRLVTADDVKYSFERALKPETGSITASYFLGDIVGARDVLRGDAEELAGLRVVNDSTVEIKLNTPAQAFLYKMTYQVAYVVDQRQITANPRRWTLKPNGTGPYKLKEWSLGERIVLEAYDNYYLGAPTLKTIRFDLAGGSALVRYEDGDIDITGVGLDDLPRVQDPNDELHDEFVQSTSQSVSYIGMNTQVPPFDDPNVRKALALSVDRKKIADVILRGAVPVATGLLAPGIPGHTDEDKTYPYDPDQARQLLAQSKYANNMPDIVLTESGTGATVGPVTEAIVQGWQDDLGIDITIEQTETGTFFSDLDEGRYQMFTLGWIMDYPDPENILDLLFYSASRQNNTRYSNPEIDAQLEDARVQRDSEQRLTIYRDVERKLVQDAPWIPLFFGSSYVLVKPYVKGYVPPPTIIERFRDVTVER